MSIAHIKSDRMAGHYAFFPSALSQERLQLFVAEVDRRRVTRCVEHELRVDGRQRPRPVALEDLRAECTGEERVVDAEERVAERRVLGQDHLVERRAGVPALEDPQLQPGRGLERPLHRLRDRERVVRDEGVLEPVWRNNLLVFMTQA